MHPIVALFFRGNAGAAALYLELVKQLHDFSRLKVKSRMRSREMLELCHRKKFAYVTLEGVRKAPNGFRLVFSLDKQLESPRIIQQTGPIQQLYSLHTIVKDKDSIDPELLGWLMRAYELTK